MIEVSIDSVRVSLTNQQRIVLLREIDGGRYLPIWIGPYEAEAITISLQEIEVARPQTHDLLIKTLEQINARLLRVEVISLKGDVFYGNLVIKAGDQTYNIDARPSDSIALAVRAHVPILVSSEILKEAGIIPDEDIVAEILDPSRESGTELQDEGEAPEARKRLSVFEDFLKNVKLDDHEDSTDDSNPHDGENGIDPDSEK